MRTRHKSQDCRAEKSNSWRQRKSHALQTCKHTISATVFETTENQVIDILEDHLISTERHSLGTMDSQSRQEYIRAAISFLQNPKLVDSPLKDKLKFLKDKGLSEIEVDEALNLALVNRHQTQGGRWNFILILGLCVGGYKLYQTYLELERAKKEDAKLQKTEQSNKSTPHGLDSLNTNAQQTRDEEGPTLVEILHKMTELKKLIELQRSNFGAEMQSLKTLLLGHEKFAAPPKIPEWQLASNDNTDKDGQQTNSTEAGTKKKKGKGLEPAKPVAPSKVFIEPTMIAPNPV